MAARRLLATALALALAPYRPAHGQCANVLPAGAGALALAHGTQYCAPAGGCLATVRLAGGGGGGGMNNAKTTKSAGGAGSVFTLSFVLNDAALLKVAVGTGGASCLALPGKGCGGAGGGASALFFGTDASPTLIAIAAGGGGGSGTSADGGGRGGAPGGAGQTGFGTRPGTGGTQTAPGAPVSASGSGPKIDPKAGVGRNGGDGEWYRLHPIPGYLIPEYRRYGRKGSAMWLFFMF
jgi:hypothetical protein